MAGCAAGSLEPPAGSTLDAGFPGEEVSRLDEDGGVFCDVALALALEDRVVPLFLEEMRDVRENGVAWEYPYFRFRVRCDGEGGFEAAALTLAE